MRWEDVLKRDDLIGGDFEFEDHGVRTRGPITGVTHIPDLIVIEVEWTATIEVNGPWQAGDLGFIFSFYGQIWPLVVVRDDYIECRPDPNKLEDHPELFHKIIRRIYPRGTNKLDPETVEGLPKLLDRSQWDYLQVSMTDDEWFALCGDGLPFDGDNPDEAYPALPICCYRQSNMRSAIQVIREQNGSVTPADHARLIGAYQNLCDGHSSDEWDWTILNKLMEQVLPGITTTDFYADDPLEDFELPKGQ